MTFTEEQFYAWIDEYEIDLDAATGWLESLEPNEDGLYTADDADGNGLPDFLDKLIEDPTATNDSQGGAIG